MPVRTKYPSDLGRLLRWLPLLGCLSLGLVPTPAWADPPPAVTLNAPGLLIKKPKPGPPDVKTAAPTWPRLDPGAVLCRTEDDLARLAANRSGGPGGGAADCRIIREPLGVTVIQRRGPGLTQVQATRDGALGWTDVWLPEKAPGGRADSAAVR
jgi:hypothetical protein